MISLLFSCTDCKGHYHECSFGGFSLEVCMEALSVLKQDGWQIQVVKLLDSDGSAIFLPSEAFDGRPLLRPIRELEQEWKAILAIDQF